MNTLYDRIMALYPDLQPQDFLTVIRLQNDSNGEGDYIAEWNHPTLPKPTVKELNDVSNTNAEQLA